MTQQTDNDALDALYELKTRALENAKNKANPILWGDRYEELYRCIRAALIGGRDAKDN